MAILTWKKTAPWLLSILSIGSIVLLAIFLMSNFDWLKTNYRINDLSSIDSRNIFLIHTALLKRVLGFFTSLLLIFVGMSISAFVMSKQTEMNFNIDKVGISIVSVSPGIIAMVLGVLLMIVSITSKDEFNFTDQVISSTTQVPTVLGQNGDLHSKDKEK
jgi:hypothetical protein